MKFSYNWLQSFFKKELPDPERLAEILTLHLAEVEEVRKEEGDFVLDIDIRPNRAGDCFSHLGIARELSAILNAKLQPGNHKLIEDKALKAKDLISVDVKSKSACLRYSARVIANVKVFPSPKWIQERLKICGLRPINNIVDATNYVMLETGQPLHAFDKEKIKGEEILVRFAQKGEKITTLDEENYDLEGNILVIADSEGPLAIAGIKGGKKAEIGPKTKTIVVESANFNSRVVRQGSKAIDLKTDASLRFEHGLDPNLTEIAVNKAAVLIQQVSGGKVVRGIVDFYPQKILPKTVKLDLGYAERLLGVEIPEKKIESILEKLEFKVKESVKASAGKRSPKILEVEVPTGRLDVSLPEDLIEEIGRIYGYEKIPARSSLIPLAIAERNLNVFWENTAKDVLAGIGFVETCNYSFVSERDLEIFKSYRKEEVVELANPLSSDFQYLRPSLIPNLLKNVEKNQKNFDEIRIFELGKIFRREKKTKGGNQVTEKRRLAGVLTGNKFYEAKGVIDVFLDKLRIAASSRYEEYVPKGSEEAKVSIWYPQRAAKIMVGEEEIGILGEITPRVSGNLKIEKKVMVFDMDFDKLSQLASEEKEYCPILRYPSALRDVAVLVPKSVKAEEVLNKIRLAGGSLVSNVDLFDVYEGDNLPEGKKNLAFHVIFQAQDRTLAPSEIDGLQDKIIKALEENPEWQVRK